MRVVVVGAGFAGVAAAFAARRAGASVTVVQHGAGSSSLYAGAVDGALPAKVPAGLAELASALGLRLGATRLATREGVVRPSAGSDLALLDLAPLAGKRIAVVDVPRDDWDAPLLARSFAASAWALETHTRFERFPLALLEQTHHRRTSSFDFAASFERAERPAWLVELLRAHAGPDAWLFGPWLGLKRPLAAELSSGAGVPVGEVTSPPGGVAGARFDMRRDALLASLGVELRRERALGIASGPQGVAVTLAGSVELSAERLVMASGGFVSGGIELRGALSGAEPSSFELAIGGLPAVRVRGELAPPISSLFGVDLAACGRSLLEDVGLAVDGSGAVAGVEHVFAAGDVLAPHSPGVAHALTSGLRAGAAAASVA